MDQLIAYGGLFLAALLAATIVPAQSEAVLAGLHLSGRFPVAELVAVATAGNVLGSALNWLLGRYLVHFRDRRWFPVKPETIDKATRWYGRWGVWSLLLAWVPMVGDPLTVVAGILRTNVWLFLVLVTVGKLGRYVAIVVAV
ncbi:MAG: DedA family protein [Rhodospirillaceae bacterium]|nr:DedA family protein [Rhodospirillales bacterium]